MRSLRARLFLATLAALAITLALTVAIGGILTRRQVDRTQAATIARLADDRAHDRREHVSYRNGNQKLGSIIVMVQLRATFATLVPNVNRPSDGETRFDGKEQIYSYRLIPQRGLLVLQPASAKSAAWRPFLTDLLLAALAGAGIAAVLSFMLARSIVRPLQRVAAATRALAADERHERLEPEGTTELAALAEAFNQMAEQLASSREAERAFLLSVSHELKTPLTAIRGYAEGLGEGAFDAREAARVIVTESGRLERLVRDLLDLARMNRAEFAVRSEAVDLAEIAREAARRHEPTARGLGVELRAVADEAWVDGDADRILQIASNLVENALRETPVGGSVTVAAEGVRLIVSDTGPGIPAADLPHAFERFYLYDKIGRDRLIGSGLGLAIVRQLATAMGGTVDVQSSAAGTTFTVTLRPQAGGVDDFEVGPVQRTERV
ncbi:MAG TPA: HAMP domain-containing sensor histidine kinase [Gaiellaceae bacterium]|nr:HAMP domain-containing sensor histidine kinase [Gaiellaceae bacterium]